LLGELVQFQQRPYSLEPVPEIQEFLNKAIIWETDVIEEFSMLLQEEEELGVMSKNNSPTPVIVFQDGPRLVACMKSVYAQDPLLRYNLKTMIRDNVTVLSSKDTTRFMAELFVELSQCKRDVLKELVKINTQIANQPTGGAAGAGKKTANDELYERFGGQKMTQWKMMDEWGVVYGWADEVSVSMLTKGEESYIVECRSTVDIAHVAVLLRIMKFYEANSKGKKPKCILLTNLISENAKRLALNSKIEVVLTKDK